MMRQRKGPLVGPLEFAPMSGIGHNLRVSILRSRRGDGAMRIPDYIAIGILLALILWAVARVYLESRRF